jgi:hypothetical protein
VKNAYYPPPQCDTYRAFIALIRLIELNPIMQDKFSKCDNPEQVIKVASSLGFKFSREDLRCIASDLYAGFLPWAGKGTAYRVNFFKDQSTIRKKSLHISKHLEGTAKEPLKTQKIKVFRVPRRTKTKALTNALLTPSKNEEKITIH